MKIPWLHIVLFVLLLVLADRFTGYVISKYAQAYEYDKRLSAIINGDLNHDAIILGSSRALIDANAEQLSQELNRDFYNLGFSGANSEFHLFVLEKLLERNHHPDTVLLFIDEFRTFTGTRNAKFRDDFIRPYVHDLGIYETYSHRVGKNYYAGVLSSVYRQNENTINALSYVLSGIAKPDITNNVNERGSVLIDEVSPSFKGEFPTEKKIYQIQEEKPVLIDSFKRIFMLCKENNIAIIPVFPPNFRTPNTAFKERINFHLPYQVDKVLLDTVLTDAQYYYDGGHLNKKGNHLFTKALAKEIKNLN